MASKSGIAREQEYFDRAGKAREASRIIIDHAADAQSRSAPHKGDVPPAAKRLT